MLNFYVILMPPGDLLLNNQVIYPAIKVHVPGYIADDVRHVTGRASGSRHMARIRAAGVDLVTGHKNNIRWMPGHFQLMNTRKIRT